ncbi:MAG: DNA-processing protein DprA [Gemmatimonadota bacterium]
MDALKDEQSAAVTLALAYPTRGRTLGDSLRASGSAVAALTEAARGGTRLPALPPEEWRALRARAAAVVAGSDRDGTHVVPWGSAAYPDRLRALADPPAVLFLHGEPRLLARPGVAVVGARNASPYGLRHAEGLARQLSQAGAVVFSGLALGIDAAAHRGALDGPGGTVGVLGAGLDVPYPHRHRDLRRRIVERGLLVTEFAPGTPPLPHHFPQRNRIVAALAAAVVVVEAGEKSGALITVDHALDLGRAVFAVPGRIDSARSRGCNQLLREGAGVVVSAASLLDDLVGVLPCALQVQPSSWTPDDPSAAHVWRRLDEPLGLDDLRLRTDLPLADLFAALTALELEGRVVRIEGDLYARADV